ncbi:MAG: hypothetical protein IH591_03480 [Bacteroidales bacterium]|nr:hypothetical protein [Bacteroidales bacterium]
MRKKAGRIVSGFIASVCLSILIPGVSAQTMAAEGTFSVDDPDSTRCDSLTTLYKDHYIIRDYSRAVEFWRQMQGE